MTVKYTKFPKRMSNMGMRRVARKAAAGQPLGAAATAYTWSTKDATIATVKATVSDTSKATVTGVAEGNTILSVTDGVATATAPINVTAAE